MKWEDEDVWRGKVEVVVARLRKLSSNFTENNENTRDGPQLVFKLATLIQVWSISPYMTFSFQASEI
jgi:hypothetical protein